MSDVRLAVIGAGIMGTNHARVARIARGADLVAVVDSDPARAELAAGSTAFATRIDDVLDHIDAAILAVPTALHHELAIGLLRAGKHLLIEKPIAASVGEAEAIVAAADEAGVTLAVGHVERFNAAVAELPKLVDAPIHIRAERINPFSPRILDGVVLDLMLHDLDIVLSLAEGAEVVHVSGVGTQAFTDSEDLASATLRFDSGLTAGLTTSRLGQQKIRQIEITQPDSVIVADLLRQDVTVHRMTSHEYLSGDGTRYRQSSVIEIPFLEQRGEPLVLEVEHFVDCIRNGAAPRVDGAAGVRALSLALVVAQSLNRELDSVVAR